MSRKNNPTSLSKYSKELSKALEKIDSAKINKLSTRLKIAISKNQKIIVMGNGGSAANAMHIAGDFMKTFSMQGYHPNISTPSDNICFLTAVSNDINYNDAYQLYLNSVVEKKSLLIFLSGSGNSINLIKSLNSTYLKNINGIESWSITAYNGGRISKLTNHWIHLPTSNMEIAEDIQLILFHFIKQKLYSQLCNNKKIQKDFSDDRYFKRTFTRKAT